MTETLDYLRSFLQFPVALRRFLRPGLTLAEAEQTIRRRMEEREENFLRIAEQSIYNHPSSPYLAMLKLARCELGDLRSLVRSEGLEAALGSLREAGVYVTFKEFKGRTPIVRQGHTIHATARAFDNPFARQDFALQTGGSTGLAASVYQDLDHIAAGAAHQVLLLNAWGLSETPVVHWMHRLPGSGLRFILQRAYFGRHPRRWFALNRWTDSRYWVKYGAATLYMVFWMRALGVRVSLPRVVAAEEAVVVARCLRDLLDEGQGALLYSSTSRGLRVCLAAQEAGIDLTGATFRVGGEPVTSAKAAAMRRSGIRVLPAYGAVDMGAIGLGCPNPAATDDVHFCKDAFAMITHPYVMPGGRQEVPSLNLTSLLETSPKVMLNYQSDDYAVVHQRSCGCQLESYGFTPHLRGIRSYSKLVGEAVTLIGDEMLPVLEQHLPARFGGSPLDYQLMEQEDGDGFTRVYLIIAPHIEIADEKEVIRYALSALRGSSPMGDSAGLVWQRAEALRVKRMAPVLTARGKMLPLHLHRPETDD